MFIKKPKPKTFEYIPRFYDRKKDLQEQKRNKIRLSKRLTFKKKENVFLLLMILIIVLFIIAINN
jgi:cell division protein FtsL